MDERLRILHLEDKENDAELIQERLVDEGLNCEVTRVKTRGDFLAAMKRGGFNLLLADYTLPGFDGRAALELALQERPDLPVIFVSGTIGEDAAIELLKSGATDYVLKEKLARLAPAVHRALREAKEKHERKRAEQALRESAITDELTGLRNRRYFNERLCDEIELAKRGRKVFSLLFCDIDHFKALNDTYGHPVGDSVLSWVSTLIRKKLRNSDLVARYGGEEFAAVLLDAEKRHAVGVAEKIRSAVAGEPFMLNNITVKITVSFGVATFADDAESLEDLIARADEAMYRAKEGGRNRVEAFRARVPFSNIESNAIP